jgi:hypothetical protein
MIKRGLTGTTLAALAACLALGAAPVRAEPVEDGATPPAERLADWVLATNDNDGLPFVIVDKVAARVSVFDAEGRLLGADAVLVGSAIGDDSVPGIGERPLSEVLPEERTTPAGRFVAGYGPASGHAKVLWVDFASAVALHPVVTSNPKERRVQRLRSETPEDNRITFGCINVAAEFYDSVVRPNLSETKSVFYILPETRTLEATFPGLYLRARAGSGPVEPTPVATGTEGVPHSADELPDSAG